MKVLLVNKFHYRKGGSETYYFALADLLRSLGHEVIYFAMDGEKNIPCEQSEFFVSNVDYNHGSIKNKAVGACKLLYSLEAKSKFEALVQREHPDIVHLNLVHRQITLSILDVCKSYHIPVVFTQHDLICACPAYTCMQPDGSICEECFSGNFMPCIKHKCIKGSMAMSAMGYAEAKLYRFWKMYEKIDCYITPSAFYKDKLTLAGFTTKPILHLPNFLPLGTSFVQEKPAVPGYLLYFGRLSREKGIYTLIHAALSTPDCHLTIAGSGPEDERLKKLVADNRAGDRITFTGFITGQALTNTVNGCFAVVLPSEWYENGPYSVMEAMACGKPVIGADIGGIPEMVQNGKTGFTFASGNQSSLMEAIQKMRALSAPDYNRMCSCSVQFAKEHFSAEKYGKQLCEIYEKLVHSEVIHNG